MQRSQNGKKPRVTFDHPNRASSLFLPMLPGGITLPPTLPDDFQPLGAYDEYNSFFLIVNR